MASPDIENDLETCHIKPPKILVKNLNNIKILNEDLTVKLGKDHFYIQIKINRHHDGSQLEKKNIISTNTRKE